jgi:membrane-associated protein
MIMEIIQQLVNIFLHLDQFLGNIISTYGTLTYIILFLVIFCETGLVVTPFLPGDSLIFAAGTFAAMGRLNPWILFIMLIIAAVGGDAVNYWIGHKIGPRAYTGEIKLIKKEYIDRTHVFFEKHGGKTIFLARFVPIVRTFAPFVAGVGQMSYGYFLRFNLVGGVTWVSLFLALGYFFGTITFVQENFELVIIAIVLVSVVPMAVEWVKSRREPKQNFS